MNPPAPQTRILFILETVFGVKGAPNVRRSHLHSRGYFACAPTPRHARDSAETERIHHRNVSPACPPLPVSFWDALFAKFQFGGADRLTTFGLKTIAPIFAASRFLLSFFFFSLRFRGKGNEISLSTETVMIYSELRPLSSNLTPPKS